MWYIHMIKILFLSLWYYSVYPFVFFSEYWCSYTTTLWNDSARCACEYVPSQASLLENFYREQSKHTNITLDIGIW